MIPPNVNASKEDRISFLQQDALKNYGVVLSRTQLESGSFLTPDTYEKLSQKLAEQVRVTERRFCELGREALKSEGGLLSLLTKDTSQYVQKSLFEFLSMELRRLSLCDVRVEILLAWLDSNEDQPSENSNTNKVKLTRKNTDFSLKKEAKK
ncbi:hypothetical protein FAI40_01750 [Acetobacteraceae bacterium]|nr:hypothetical protein FAI40_01750 [Acetobacteraceae bacterium]